MHMSYLTLINSLPYKCTHMYMYIYIIKMPASKNIIYSEQQLFYCIHYDTLLLFEGNTFFKGYIGLVSLRVAITHAASAIHKKGLCSI